jgi:pimeloyl-ACP methyl ester carboxylesterase
MFKRTMIVFITSIGILLGAAFTGLAQDEANPQSGYASVNGLEMYYEIHGEDTGMPLVMLHGAFMNIDLLGDFVSGLAETRQVIGVELQGHGRTNDIADRPLSYEQMADDVAALMDEIGVEKADIFGYSLGGGVALQMGVRHPERVNKLVVVSATYSSDGWYPELMALMETMTAEMFAGSPPETEYMRLAPNPENWPMLVEKVAALNLEGYDWPAEDIEGIESPALIIVADSDQVSLEHAVELFRLFGGGVPADFVGQPESQLAIIPGTGHVSVMFRADLLTPMIAAFLDTPLSEQAG